MGAVIASLFKAVRQLGDPAILRTLAKSMLITLVIFMLGGAALWWALDASIEQWIIANLPADYSNAVAGIVAVSFALLAGWLLFRIVALAVLQFFADEIVMAVEKRHYPAAAEGLHKLPFREDAVNSLRGAWRAMLFNGLAAIVALILLFTAIGPAIVFWLVNAVLLGRELTDMSWLRHRPSPDHASPAGAIERVVLGGAITAMMVVPIANLLAPVIGAAAATHLVQSRIREANG